MKISSPKFEPKSVDGIFLGYSSNSTNKRVLHLDSRIVEEAYNVKVCRFTDPVPRKGPDWLFDYEKVFGCYEHLFTKPITTISDVLSHDNEYLFRSLFDFDDISPVFEETSGTSSSSVNQETPTEVDTEEEFHDTLNDPTLINDAEIQGENLTNLEETIAVE